ncbi:Hypothetical_protein [Hexamita inflata]|uniref:Hypothetical_protein n=1 Tax=Hexamita inflata TaxID=28002 RepID=A0AA86TNN4_9EUKA|nr:Hypothetical protein HINF_LOCUS10575 [Hexamita inflata]
MANIYVEQIHNNISYKNNKNESEGTKMKMNHIMSLSELHSSGTYDIYTNISFLVLITYMFLKLMRHLRRTLINTSKKDVKKDATNDAKKLYPSYSASFCVKKTQKRTLFYLHQLIILLLLITTAVPELFRLCPEILISCPVFLSTFNSTIYQTIIFKFEVSSRKDVFVYVSRLNYIQTFCLQTRQHNGVIYLNLSIQIAYL